MNLFIPFEVNSWRALSSDAMFLFRSSFGLLGALVLSVSQFLLRPLFRLKALTVLSAFLWFLFEILLLSIVMHMVYDQLYEDHLTSLVMFSKTLKYTFLVAVIPYGMFIFYFYHKEKIIDSGKTNNIIRNDNQFIHFKDENGKVRISLLSSDIILLESQDNYVSIHYLNNKDIQKYLLRISMTSLEEQLKGTGLIRCHRRFVVNLNKVLRINHTSKNLKLILNVPSNQLVPVSSTYASHVIDLLQHKN
ncbi:LytTR family DNA-binding domain-containing protein [Fulvivirgaceae bacterium BMA10]|uniref:LytTR family DNA-binding domain-containing protein n=1 Tax=Splendidivirga corallicola TaxID=3051826 RepID=A0ABT8KRU9_9BACT|nr:LytTR family DNA-binding domain-containing protein [Fulvivirgaceae bacterium BMA10]